MQKIKMIEKEVHESLDTVYRSKVSEWANGWGAKEWVIWSNGRRRKKLGKKTLLTRCLHKYPLICFEDHLPKHFVRNKFKLKAKKEENNETKKNRSQNTLQSNRNVYGVLHKKRNIQRQPNDYGLFSLISFFPLFPSFATYTSLSFFLSDSHYHFFCSLCPILKENQYISLTDIIKNWIICVRASWFRRCHFLVHCYLLVSFFFCFSQFLCVCVLFVRKQLQDEYKYITHSNKWNVATENIFLKCSAICESNKQIAASPFPYHSFEIVTIHCYSFKKKFEMVKWILSFIVVCWFFLILFIFYIFRARCFTLFYFLV